MVKVGSLRSGKRLFNKFKLNRLSRKLRNVVGGAKQFYRKNDKAINMLLGTAATLAAAGVAYKATSKNRGARIDARIARNNESDVVQSVSEGREIKRAYNDQEAQIKAYEQLKFEEQNRQAKFRSKNPHRSREIQQKVYPSSTSSYSSYGPSASSSSKINLWQYS